MYLFSLMQENNHSSVSKGNFTKNQTWYGISLTENSNWNLVKIPNIKRYDTQRWLTLIQNSQNFIQGISFTRTQANSKVQGKPIGPNQSKEQRKGMQFFASYRNQCRCRIGTSALQRRHKEGTGALKCFVS